MSFRTFCISQNEKDLAIKIKDSLPLLEMFYAILTFNSLFRDKGRKCFIEVADSRCWKAFHKWDLNYILFQNRMSGKYTAFHKFLIDADRKRIISLFKFQFLGDFFKLQHKKFYCLNSCFNHVFENHFCIHRQRKFITSKL